MPCSPILPFRLKHHLFLAAASRKEKQFITVIRRHFKMNKRVSRTKDETNFTGLDASNEK